ncbi:glycoside hydrolase family 31 protein [Marinimicrobium sp. C2-29]|uniref:glycoside hydrolase family 31 protein n=1 Tax=Marinimicrobium sp. C2-29 TaxID=3139825 RepID=UPI0031388142
MPREWSYVSRQLFIRGLVLLCVPLFIGIVEAKASAGEIESEPEREGNVIRFSTTSLELQIEFCTPSMVRIRSSRDREFDEDAGLGLMVTRHDWPAVAVSTAEETDFYELESEQLLVRVYKSPVQLEFYSSDGTLLSTERIEDGGMVQDEAGVSVHKKLHDEEQVFGFGQRMDFVNQRGKQLELTVGRGMGRPHIIGAYNILEANYSPVPFFMSTRGYGTFLHTPYTSNWDMGKSDPGAYSFQAEGGELDYYFMAGAEFPSLLDQYTSVTGKSPLLPKFAHGLHVGTYSGGTWGYEKHTSTDYVVNLGRKFREKNIPVDLIHLDSTWRMFGEQGGSGATTFEWRETFDDPEAMFDQLYEMGYSMVGVHVRPRYDNGKQYKLLDRAREAGMVYPEPDNAGEFVNFFDQEAVDWWWENGAMKVVSQGAMFFKTDEGSAFGRKANESDKTGPTGPEAERLHNLFPLAYAKAPFEKFSEHNEMRGFNLTREGYAGIQRYPYLWAGDWPSEWQYFKPVIRAGLNMGLSGVGYWSHNMGGFEHDPDPELYIRWSQFGLFSPIAHLFGMDHPGYKEPWSYGEEAERIFKQYDRMRYRFIPYIYSEAYQMHRTGMPMMRALVLEYQDDENTHDIDDQYLFGRNLLIAPVTTKGAQTRVVYLPEGTWYGYWSGEPYEGKRYYNIVTPLEKLPIFVKAGGILPQQKVLNLGRETADTINLEIFPGGESSYDIYDDDGKSKAYESGDYAITEVSAKEEAEQTLVSIKAPRGDYKLAERSYTLKIRRDSAPESVTEESSRLPAFSALSEYENSQPQAGWYFDEEAGALYVRLAGSSQNDISVVVKK